MMNDEKKIEGGKKKEARKSGRAEKTICENLCNLWTYVFVSCLPCVPWALYFG